MRDNNRLILKRPRSQWELRVGGDGYTNLPWGSVLVPLLDSGLAVLDGGLRQLARSMRSGDEARTAGEGLAGGLDSGGWSFLVFLLGRGGMVRRTY